MGARTISLWGPGSIDLYGPFGREKETQDIIYKRYLCSPCLYVYRTNAGYFCGGKAPCMEDIRPAEVMDLVRKKICVIILNIIYKYLVYGIIGVSVFLSFPDSPISN